MDVPKTLGALLIGALFASLCSGGVVIQTLLYLKLYPSDSPSLKSLVLIIWLLDTFHTAFIWGALWEYLVDFYGKPDLIDRISWTLAMSIVFTAILTFCTHCFFAHRILKLSKKNWWLTAPIFVLAVLRLTSASGTTAQMLKLQSFAKFRDEVHWLFTLGLALSCMVDILITGSLFFLLQTSRGDAGNLNVVIDTLILYTFETGSITAAATIVSMICWIAMPTNLIFMGLHFVIGKLYANSFLVTLNTRRNLREQSYQSGGGGFPALVLTSRSRRSQAHSDESVRFFFFFFFLVVLSHVLHLCR
ncbi:hypothetical protein Moror_4553 [Moniliophthora roreri MCA 2997]|uniref:DUF6534 domain-containing protein n=1 Tax=Moniliophthora roreri (strain MCA 2997) TaxID=1381753 RepID=V2XFC0_MONRO|nr:hypothetical protein Moror_4553 [Moniliophthora roreri MCA 2997]